MPLSDRDYMRRTPSSYRKFDLDPIWAIIGINAVVFVIAFMFDVISPMSNPVVYFLGLQPIAFLSRPWTIITSMFTHYDMWHILTNMLTLYFFGRFLVALVGERRFLFIYFIGGLLGGIFYIIITFLGQLLAIRFFGSPFTIAIGASGAVYALGGALVALRPQQRVYLYFFIPVPLWLAVIGGFLLLWQGVAWQAHLGGLLFGLGAGLLIKRQKRFYY